MKFYLSSYKVGDKTNLLKQMVKGKIGFIPNSLDFVDDLSWRESNEKNIRDLTDLGIEVELLDLRDYFGKKEKLKKKLDGLAGVWVRGGNTFILRRAMSLSGFDELIKKIERKDFLYGGYSAGVCVLAPSLKGLSQVDNPSLNPYNKSKKIIWEGLGLLNFLILPHYKSDHPESKLIDQEVEFCRKNKIPFKTLRDGETIIL